MKEFSLYDMDSVDLIECIENMKFELRKNNTEYRKLCDEIENIKYQFPNVRGVLEDEKITKMSAEESQALLEAINLYRELLRIEEYEIFLLGGKECFGYLKKIKVI